MLFLSGLVLLAILVFYAIISADIPGMMKFILVVFEMFIVSNILIKKYNLSGQSGVILLRSKKGLGIIENLAKHNVVWNFFADVGSVACYGFLSFILFRKVSLKSALFGFALLIALVFLVSPFLLPFLSYVIKLPVGDVSGSGSLTSNSYLPLVFLVLIFLGGLFFVLLSGLIIQAVFILENLALRLLGQSVSAPSAGATLILPGINIPFFEGLIALLIVLIVHEGAHAILARVAKIKVLSSGIVLFGIIPIGAFVEPDEDELGKVDRTKQTRVIVAGSTSNFITSLVFFVILFAFLYFTSDFKESGLLVTSGFNESTVIKSINGIDVTRDLPPKFDLPPDSEVLLLTNKGELLRKTDANGKMGITFIPLQNAFYLAEYSNPALQFSYVTLILIFALNFIIGTVNILPLPFFDGYRTLSVNIENKKIVSMVMSLTLAAFLVNLLPNVF